MSNLFQLCMSCGRLKAESLFEEADCTCKDCYNEGRSSPMWRENSDGSGYVAVNDD